jgi:hypothetical protein
LHWITTEPLPLRANARGSDDLNDGSEFVAVARAAANWQTAVAACSPMTFEVREPSASAAVGYVRNGPNETAIVWMESGWTRDAEHDSAMVAVTPVVYLNAPGTARDGMIVDADIELNGETFHFSTAGAPDKMDVENTLTHELGHLLGLDHPCYAQTPAADAWPRDQTGQPIPACSAVAGTAVSETTLYPTTSRGETKRRSPEADDVAGVCAAYPPEAPGCAIGLHLGGAEGCPAASLVFFVTGLWLALRFFRSKSKDNPSWLARGGPILRP